MGTRQVTVQRPTQIQICPWFIDFIENNDYKLGNDVAGSNIGRAGIQLSKKYNWPFQEIGTILCKLQNWNITDNINLDAFSLLDKVLLHEMTHGRTAFEESRVPGGEKETIDDVRLAIITSAINPRLRDWHNTCRWKFHQDKVLTFSTFRLLWKAQLHTDGNTLRSLRNLVMMLLDGMDGPTKLQIIMRTRMRSLEAWRNSWIILRILCG
jgi:hypothetical protein